MNPLMALFAGEPALVSAHHVDRFEACLIQAAAHPLFEQAMAGRADVGDDFWCNDGWQARVRPYTIVNGILQIPVKGVLLHDFPYALGDFATGYDYIWQAFKRGCGDYVTGTIRGIAFMEDTPGGMVAGCFDAVDRMVGLKEQTGVPVRAFAHESAYSAGYAIATVADHIAVSRTGGVGSIGVVTTHIDRSGALQQAGIKVTFIASDPSKVEGNSMQPLSDEAKARIQGRIDELTGIFIAAVVRGRGLDEAVIRGELKAYCFTATQALSNGLADSIGSLEDATSAFAGFLDNPSNNNGEEAMADQVNTAAVDRAAHESAVATARTEGHTAGLTEGQTAGATAERELVFAILDSDEGKKRPAAARALASEGGRTLEQAQAFLAKLPEETVPAAPAAEQPGATGAETPFNAAMGTGNPGVGPGGGGGGDAPTDGSDVVALARKVGIVGFKPAQSAAA